MSILYRLNLMMKGRLNSLLDAVEDPERSLNQVVIDMEEELDAAKRAVARAMANEDRLRAQIAFHAKDAGEWQRAAERALGQGGRGRRPAGPAPGRARRTSARQARPAAREAVARRPRRSASPWAACRSAATRRRAGCRSSRPRCARSRRGGPSAACWRALRAHNLTGHFERISVRVEEEAATERNYQKIDDELSGEDLRRRFEADAVADAVDDRLARLREGQPQ